jgi:hypothetical protein
MKTLPVLTLVAALLFTPVASMAQAASFAVDSGSGSPVTLSVEEKMVLGAQFEAMERVFTRVTEKCGEDDQCAYAEASNAPEISNSPQTPWGTPVTGRFYPKQKMWAVIYPDLGRAQCDLVVEVVKAHGAPPSTSCSADGLEVFYRVRKTTAELSGQGKVDFALQFANIRDLVFKVRQACDHDAACAVDMARDFAWIARASTPWGTEVSINMDLQTGAFTLTYPDLTPDQCKVAQKLFLGLKGPKDMACTPTGLKAVFP